MMNEMENGEFVIDGYLLILDESNFLVLADECDWDRSLHTASDLPGWVFESRLVIWLSVGEESLRLRALEGERVRYHLLASLSREKIGKAG